MAGWGVPRPSWGRAEHILHLGRCDDASSGCRRILHVERVGVVRTRLDALVHTSQQVGGFRPAEHHRVWGRGAGRGARAGGSAAIGVGRDGRPRRILAPRLGGAYRTGGQRAGGGAGPAAHAGRARWDGASDSCRRVDSTTGSSAACRLRPAACCMLRCMHDAAATHAATEHRMSVDCADGLYY